MRLFLEFWWDCLVYGWNIGYGAFCIIEATCGVTLAILLWRQKIHKNAKEWEEPVMKFSAFVLLASFFISTVFIAPFVKITTSDSEKAGAIDIALTWSNRYVKAQEKRTSDQGQPSAAVTNAINRLAERIDRDSEENKRLIVASASGGNTAQLKAIVDLPIVLSQPVTTGPIDFSERDADLKKFRTREKAALQLAKLQHGTNDLAILNAILPVLRASIERFKGGLMQLAAANGDMLISPQIDLIEISSREWNKDFETLRLEKNSSWDFKVYFRKESNFGNYGLYIIGGNSDLTCHFDINGFGYKIAGAPEGAGANGSGKLSDFSEEKLSEILRWFISIHKESNVLQSYAK